MISARAYTLIWVKILWHGSAIHIIYTHFVKHVETLTTYIAKKTLLWCIESSMLILDIAYLKGFFLSETGKGKKKKRWTSIYQCCTFFHKTRPSGCMQTRAAVCFIQVLFPIHQKTNIRNVTYLLSHAS